MKCIHCRKKPAKWREEGNPRNAYCGKACQIGYLLIKAGGDDDEIVVLRASDGITLTSMTFKDAEKMEHVQERVKTMIDLQSFEPIDTPFDNQILQLVKNVLIVLRNEEERDRTRLLVMIDNLNQNDFINLLYAAVWLDFKELLWQMIPQWIRHGPFPGGIRPLMRDVAPMALYFVDDPDRLQLLGLSEELLRPIQTFIDERGRGNWEPLAAAAFNGQLEVLEYFVERERRSTPLYFALQMAAENGHLHVVDWLLNNFRPGDDAISAVNIAVQSAARTGQTAVVERFLQDPRVTVRNGVNASLTLAAEKGHLSVVKLLIPHADIIGINNAFGPAADQGRLAVMELLLPNPDIASHVLGIIIRQIAESGRLVVIERLLQDERVLADDINAALRAAITNNRLATMELLLTDPRISSLTINSLVLSAANMKKWALVERLFKDVRFNDAAIIKLAIRKAGEDGQLELVKMWWLVHPLAIANDKFLFQDALRWAIKAEDIPMMDWLLNSFRYEEKFLAYLFRDEAMGHLPAMQKLFEQSNYIRSNVTFESVIYSAAKREHAEIVRWLFQNIKEFEGKIGLRDAFLITIPKNNRDIIKLFLESQRLTHQIINDGLVMAGWNGNFETAKMLLEWGADIETLKDYAAASDSESDLARFYEENRTIDKKKLRIQSRVKNT